jgi:hemerythrin
MEWNAKLATGISKIDEGLEIIINRINVTRNLDTNTLDEAEIDRIIRFFGGHVIDNFQLQEEFMLKYAYPKYDEHKGEHMKFLKNFGTLKKLFSEEKTPSLMIVVVEYEYLNWLIKHIQTFDQEMASFLISRQRMPQLL